MSEVSKLCASHICLKGAAQIWLQSEEQEQIFKSWVDLKAVFINVLQQDPDLLRSYKFKHFEMSSSLIVVLVSVIDFSTLKFLNRLSLFVGIPSELLSELDSMETLEIMLQSSTSKVFDEMPKKKWVSLPTLIFEYVFGIIVVSYLKFISSQLIAKLEHLSFILIWWLILTSVKKKCRGGIASMSMSIRKLIDFVGFSLKYVGSGFYKSIGVWLSSAWLACYTIFLGALLHWLHGNEAISGDSIIFLVDVTNGRLMDGVPKAIFAVQRVGIPTLKLSETKIPPKPPNPKLLILRLSLPYKSIALKVQEMRGYAWGLLLTDNELIIAIEASHYQAYYHLAYNPLILNRNMRFLSILLDEEVTWKATLDKVYKRMQCGNKKSKSAVGPDE
ncbi:hypothetical protein Sjap_013741 [Stephania japonica]|uniref:Uncharacterized protein n=1 Tax=Stephania japonica TaxID=461633 RepID=A0AAP0IYJ7_9MAGN